MSTGHRAEWEAFIQNVVDSQSYGSLYEALTGLEAPVIGDSYKLRDLVSPRGSLADFLYLITLRKWGIRGVPPTFIRKAKERWPQHPPINLESHYAS